jgi:FkbM family methyltransferase
MRPGGKAEYNILSIGESCLDAIAADESTTREWLDKTVDENTCFWDVGANLGMYSLHALSLNERVQAVLFEPASSNIEVCNRNLALNDFQDRAWTFPIALDEHSRIGFFSTTGFCAGSSSHRGVEEQTNDFRDTPNQVSIDAGCPIYSLDDFFRDMPSSLKPPTHIKIDVDGVEVGIVKGARELLRNPILQHVMVECFTAEEENEVTENLVAAGFSLATEPISGFGVRLFSRDASLRVSGDPRASLVK